MKRLLSLYTILCMLLCLCACSSTSTNTPQVTTSGKYNTETNNACNHFFFNATCDTPSMCAYCKETIGSALGHNYSNGKCTRCGKTDPNYSSVAYISDRRVQYDSATQRQIIFFGLQDSTNTYTAASGTASVIITDKSNYTLYQKDITFTPDDFTNWNNTSWDSPRYLCGLYINNSDIQGSASSSGTLSLKVTLDDGTWFNATTLSISDLPSISVNIVLPQIPSSYKDIRYSYTSTVQVSKLTYESSTSYDGTATVRFEAILKLLSKTANSNESSAVSVGYKLYDSDGIVVDSGHIYSNPIAIGESSKEDFTIYDLDPRETYTLKLENAS